jgi:hypothetical protein
MNLARNLLVQGKETYGKSYFTISTKRDSGVARLRFSSVEGRNGSQRNESVAETSGNYEINTWVWLNELSRKYERPVTLAAVPSEEWDYLSFFGADAVWFMGIWERSPAGTAIANQNKGLLEDFRPGFYRTLLKAASLEEMRNGHWQLCERTGWPENASYQNLVAWCWRNAGEYHPIG